MTDDEITRQIERLRSHLQDEPDDAVAKENLTTLESVFSSRQTSAPASSADASQPVEQADAQPLPADDAMSGVHFVFSVPSPRTEGTIDRFNMKRAFILLVPQLRDKETDTPKVVYYIGYRTDAKRNEYVFGPDSLDLFTTNLDVFKTMGDTAFADPDVLDYIVGFGDAVWDQQGDIVTQYLSWLGVEDYQNSYAYFVQEGKAYPRRAANPAAAAGQTDCGGEGAAADQRCNGGRSGRAASRGTARRGDFRLPRRQ